MCYGDQITIKSLCRPKICGNENDRICSNGPTLQFMFDTDDVYKSTTEKILNYFNENFEAVYKYLKRLNYVQIIYSENENLDRKTIENETGKYKI